MPHRMLIQAGTVVTLDGEGRILEPGYLRLQGDALTEVDAGEGRARDDEELLDLSASVVMPGLVNAHTHTPMVLFRGLAEGHSLLTFEGWYRAIRSWEAVLEADWIGPAVAVSCAEMIRMGTTTFADQYFHMDRIVPVVRESGLRAALAYGIVEMGEPSARERELEAAAQFLEAVGGEPLIEGWIGPHALFVDNSPQAIELELQLADRYQTGLHIHFSTSGEEDRFCHQHFGTGAVEQLERLGVLDHQILAAHCLTVPREDFDRLAGRTFSAVLCPSAGMRAGARAAPARAMAAAGLNLALGTDNVANNNSYDLFNELGTAAKLSSYRESQPGALSARGLLRMATMGGARALGLEDRIGSLEAGKQADLIALDLGAPGWRPRAGQDLYTALVYAVSGMHVTHTMVAGRWLYRRGEWLTLDYGAACHELEEVHGELRRRRAGRGANATPGD